MNRAPLSDSQGKKAGEKSCGRSIGQVSYPVGVVLSISGGGATIWLASEGRVWREVEPKHSFHLNRLDENHGTSRSAVPAMGCYWRIHGLVSGS